MRRQLTGLKRGAEAADRIPDPVVGEHPARGEAGAGRRGGARGGENAGMSNGRSARNASAASLRVPGQGSSSQGQSGAKARPIGVADAQQADIPVPLHARYNRWGDREGQPSGVLDVPVKAHRGPRVETSAGRPRDARRSDLVKSVIPCSREKPLGSACGARTKTDTGRRVENTEAIGETMVKELGKIVP